MSVYINGPWHGVEVSHDYKSLPEILLRSPEPGVNDGFVYKYERLREDQGYAKRGDYLFVGSEYRG